MWAEHDGDRLALDWIDDADRVHVERAQAHLQVRLQVGLQQCVCHRR